MLKSAKQKKNKFNNYNLPHINLINYHKPKILKINKNKIHVQVKKLKHAFINFGIKGEVRKILVGPVVTSFEFVPAPGVKLSRIVALANDIAMAMESLEIRIVAPIPGKGAVGIELPNDIRETVFLKEVIENQNCNNSENMLEMALGKDIFGNPIFVNLSKMPHLLIAGSTGSGKSVSINAMICSILYKARPDDVKFLMIDPKMLELSIYNGIPHLLIPPIIDSKKAYNALKWVVREMEKRYFFMNKIGVRNLDEYNKKIIFFKKNNKLSKYNKYNFKKLPLIVIVIDEYADLITTSDKEVESILMRLTQKARACGIHVILATQRPSVDIITGIIKTNFPARIGFKLASGHDSMTIINKFGAEKLLGYGDMLLMLPWSSYLQRIHGAFISEIELLKVINFWKNQKKHNYNIDIM